MAAGKVATEETAASSYAAPGSAQASRSVTREIPLIFEESSTGRSGSDLDDGDASERRARDILGDELCRDDIAAFPELSEPQVLRHFLRLSQLNF